VSIVSFYVVQSEENMKIHAEVIVDVPSYKCCTVTQSFSGLCCPYLGVKMYSDQRECRLFLRCKKDIGRTRLVPTILRESKIPPFKVYRCKKCLETK